jgi:hypothetical protein
MHMLAKLGQVSTYLYDLVMHFGATPWVKKIGDAVHRMGEGGAVGVMRSAQNYINIPLYKQLSGMNDGHIPEASVGAASSPYFIPGPNRVAGTRLDRNRLKQALANLESGGGNYNSSSPRADDPSYGKYQFTPDTLASMWSYDKTTNSMAKRLGKYSPELYKYFLKHHDLQEKLMDAKLNEYVASGARNVAEFGVAHNAGSGRLNAFKGNESRTDIGYQDYPHRLVDAYNHPGHGFSDTVTDKNGNVFDVKTTIVPRPNSSHRARPKTHR